MSSETIDFVIQLEDLITQFADCEDEQEIEQLGQAIDGMIRILLGKGAGFIRLIDRLKIRQAQCEAEVEYYKTQLDKQRIRANSIKGRIKWLLEERVRPIIESTGKPIEVDGRRIQIVNAAPSYRKPETPELPRGFEEDPVFKNYVHTPPKEAMWSKMAADFAMYYKIVGADGTGGTDEQRGYYERLCKYIERKQTNYVKIY